MSHGFSTKNTADLVAALSASLNGTHGRELNQDALRSLVRIELSEWRAELSQAAAPAHAPEPQFLLLRQNHGA